MRTVRLKRSSLSSSLSSSSLPPLLPLLALFLLLISSAGLVVQAAVVVVATNDTFRDRQAAFGPNIPDTEHQRGIRGRLVLADRLSPGNVEACLPLVEHPPNVIQDFDRNAPSRHQQDPLGTDRSIALMFGAVEATKLTEETAMAGPNANVMRTTPQVASRGNSDDPWIALVQRGKCAFVDKVRNAQAAGAVGVIVGDRESNTLLTMYSAEDTSDIEIPAVYVGRSAYFELRAMAALPTPPVEVVLLHEDIEPMPLLDILVITVLSPTLMMAIVYLMHRLRVRQQRKRDLAPVEAVAAIPTKRYKTPQQPPASTASSAGDQQPQDQPLENIRTSVNPHMQDPTDCAICLEDYIDDDVIRVLPCRHQYHANCVDPWLTTRKRFCPICKQDACPALKEQSSSNVLVRAASRILAFATGLDDDEDDNGAGTGGGGGGARNVEAGRAPSRRASRVGTNRSQTLQQQQQQQQQRRRSSTTSTTSTTSSTPITYEIETEDGAPADLVFVLRPSSDSIQAISEADEEMDVPENTPLLLTSGNTSSAAASPGREHHLFQTAHRTYELIGAAITNRANNNNNNSTADVIDVVVDQHPNT